jgi:hypothetical protein
LPQRAVTASTGGAVADRYETNPVSAYAQSLGRRRCRGRTGPRPTLMFAWPSERERKDRQCCGACLGRSVARVSPIDGIRISDHYPLCALLWLALGEVPAGRLKAAVSRLRRAGLVHDWCTPLLRARPSAFAHRKLDPNRIDKRNLALSAEGVGFEPTRDPEASNGFRDIPLPTFGQSGSCKRRRLTQCRGRKRRSGRFPARSPLCAHALNPERSVSTFSRDIHRAVSRAGAGVPLSMRRRHRQHVVRRALRCEAVA